MTHTPAAHAPLVILIHGMGRGPRYMKPLRQFLEVRGFAVDLWSYRSLKHEIQVFGQRLAHDLNRYALDGGPREVHIVGHSLGGIVARHALTLGIPSNFGRVATLGTPHHGCQSALTFKLLSGVATPLAQLKPDPTSWVNQLARPDGVDIGTIGSDWDGKVTAAEAHLRGETDTIVGDSYHPFIVKNPVVHQQVLAFLTNGRFLPRGVAHALHERCVADAKRAKVAAKAAAKTDKVEAKAAAKEARREARAAKKRAGHG